MLRELSRLKEEYNEAVEQVEKCFQNVGLIHVEFCPSREEITLRRTANIYRGTSEVLTIPFSEIKNLRDALNSVLEE